MRGLAEEILFPCCGQGGVRICAPNHAELVRIDPELLLQLHTDLQSGPGVLILQHPVFFGFEARDVGLVPRPVVGELVVG